jgi:predicted AlkP superfamily pyrophosphatase or phosphodiesterase
MRHHHGGRSSEALVFGRLALRSVRQLPLSSVYGSFAADTAISVGKRTRPGSAMVALILALGAIFGCAQAPRGGNKTDPARPEHVIVISVDGMGPYYYTAAEALGVHVPNLNRLKSGGAYAEGVEGVYPTLTYPSHTTLVTGVRPAAHGIVQNRIFEPPTEPQARAWYWYANAVRTEALWTQAKKAKATTAAIAWPVTVGAEIDYNVPEIYEPGETPATWKRVAQHSTPGLLEKALGSELKEESGIDERVTTVSEFVIESFRPSLMLVHLVELDAAQHRNGPLTGPAIEVAEREDRYIGRIVQATREADIFGKTTFFIVSDHGFMRVDQKFSPNVALAREGLITLDSHGRATNWRAAAWPAGGSCAIVVRDADDRNTLARIQAVFTKWETQAQSPIARLISHEELERMGAIPQAALMLEAAPGFSFDDSLTGPEVHPSEDTLRGTHGYLPTNPEMRASLVVYGVGVRSGAIVPLVQMVDIAPTIAVLLDLSLPHAEGKPIEQILQR